METQQDGTPQGNPLEESLEVGRLIYGDPQNYLDIVEHNPNPDLDPMDEPMPDGRTVGETLELIRQVEERHRRRQLEDPATWGRVPTPFRPVMGDGHGAIFQARLDWLRDNHPEETRMMERAETLYPHLKATERAYQRTFDRIRDQMLRHRHLVREAEVMRAHPEITEQDRITGTQWVEQAAREIAFEEVVHAF